MDLVGALRLKAATSAVKTTVCATWDEFVQDVRRVVGRSPFGQVFRGQADYDWCLQSRWERTFDRMRRFDKSRSIQSFAPDHAGFDRLGVTGFKRYAESLHGIQLPTEDDEDGWLLLAQHHGLETRVLDWTRSPYVAAFFDPTSFRILRPRRLPGARWYAQDALATRLVHDTHLDVESYLRARGKLNSLERWWIPTSEWRVALRDLSLMNISYASLFPDLDGAAREVNVDHSAELL